MFIKLELWDEQPPAGGQLPDFGRSAYAYVNTRIGDPRYLSINLSCIMAFEEAKVHAVGRPDSGENRSDTVRGGRLQLADGTRYIVFDDQDIVFETALVLARKAELIYDHGRSGFMHCNRRSAAD